MRRFGFFIRLLLVILMLCFIWGHSLMPGEASSRESEFFLALVRPVVAVLQRVLAAGGVRVSQSLLVRKLAHFTEYAVLGVLMYLLFAAPDGRGRIVLPALLCVASAGVDECIQIFAADRGPALRDVCLDTAGACVGILMAALLLPALVRAVKRRRAGE